MKPTCLVAAVLLLGSQPGIAEESEPGVAVAECMLRNLPEPDSIRTLRITAIDRLGAKQTTIAKVSGRRTAAGLRRVLVRFTEPQDLRGSAFLMLENENGNEMYFRSSDIAEVKRITGVQKGITLFGTDFTYADFEQLQALNRPGETKRREDQEVGGRPVYVVETHPAVDEGSSYATVVTYVDKKTCVALRMELYEERAELRKVLSANPEQVLKRGKAWIPHMLLMKDLRDETQTQILVESVNQDVRFSDLNFSVEALQGLEN